MCLIKFDVINTRFTLENIVHTILILDLRA